MARAHFKNITTENEGKAIEKYYKSVNIKSPWEINPIALTVLTESAIGQQLLQAGRTGITFNLNTAASKQETQNTPI